MSRRNDDRKSEYNREYYRKNRERILEEKRRQRNNATEGAGSHADCCRYCVRFSRSRGDRSGWCMKHRRTVGANDVCPSFRAEVKCRYEYPVHAVAIFEGE